MVEIAVKLPSYLVEAANKIKISKCRSLPKKLEHLIILGMEKEKQYSWDDLKPSVKKQLLKDEKNVRKLKGYTPDEFKKYLGNL